MWLQLVTVLIGILSALYLWSRKKYSYFRSKGIAEEPGYFPLGSNYSWKMLTGRLAFVEITNDSYNNFPNEKIVGQYGPLGSKTIVIRDLEIAKHILVKDFDHFIDRRPLDLSKKANKYFVDMLSMLTGEKWKTMRGILSPVFTSGKLKSMMPIIHKTGDEFVEFLSDFTSEFDAKEMLTSFTLDVIASAGLGVEARSFTEPNNLIRQKVDLLLGVKNSDPFGMVRLLFMVAFPKIAKYLDFAFSNREATEFLAQIVKSSFELRKKEKIRRNDLIDIMLDALKDYQSDEKSSNESESQFEADAKIETNAPKKSFTGDEIEEFLISNALMMFLVGFDTSSNAMALTSYFLATNPDVQEELFREVEEAILNNGGDQHLDYNAIQSLPYLDQVVLETLRSYPVTILERLCVKDYKIPGVDFVVPKGMLVQVASPGLMKDKKFYSQPGVFNPDNFSPEKKSERSPYAFLAFGQGPRNCIGMRFALLQVKTAIARLVFNYKILRSTKTVDQLIPDPLSRSMLPKGGIWIKVEKRN